MAAISVICTAPGSGKVVWWVRAVGIAVTPL
jgi:hypothetical protein